MRRFGGMTRPERFAASTQQISPLPIPLPLQNEVVDERRLLTVPWVSLFQWVLNIGTRTFVTGTHAERVDPDGPYDPANFRPGTWFWESDRTVLYQVRIVPVIPATVPPSVAPQWVYVLGTMEAPLASMPTDLGPYDARFQFDATDTGQSFFWDGTDWIDITAYPVTLYGTHAERLAAPVDALGDGAFWCEIDRSNVLYQLQAGIWWYVSGTMFGTMVPDERPTDLGVHEGGFEFRTSDFPARHFIWSQTAWVEVTPATATVLFARANAALGLTTTPQTVAGTSLVLPNAGKYLISAVYYFNFQSADQGQTLVGGFSGSAVGVAALTVAATATTVATTIGQQWLYTSSAGATVFLSAYKTGGPGGSTVGADHTTISAVWLGV